MFVAARVFDRLRAAERADRLLLPADLAAAAGKVDARQPQLPVDVRRRDPEREQPVELEVDADLAVDAADALDAADAARRSAAHGRRHRRRTRTAPRASSPALEAA